MKIFIMADMEGISGILKISQVDKTGEHYQHSRRYMTWDVNACVEGCFKAGATQVVVRDAHGYNFIWEELDNRATYIQGSFKGQRMPDIDKFNGLILLGYHAMAGTSEAILAHTMIHKNWEKFWKFWINDIECGEIAIDAGIAGDNNVPCIMVSGDDKTCVEARSFLKNVITVEVKKGLSCEAGILLSKENAYKNICSGTVNAIKNYKNIKPYKIKSPVKMKLRLAIEDFRKQTYIEIVNSKTNEVSGNNVEDAFNKLLQLKRE